MILAETPDCQTPDSRLSPPAVVEYAGGHLNFNFHFNFHS